MCCGGFRGCIDFLRLCAVEVFTLKVVVVGNTQVDCAGLDWP